MYYGKNITFRIRAYFIDENGTVIYSQPSNTVKTTFCPVQPKITSLTKKAGKKLTVKWKKSDYAVGYQVWRSVIGLKVTGWIIRIKSCIAGAMITPKVLYINKKYQ